MSKKTCRFITQECTHTKDCAGLFYKCPALNYYANSIKRCLYDKALDFALNYEFNADGEPRTNFVAVIQRLNTCEGVRKERQENSETFLLRCWTKCSQEKCKNEDCEFAQEQKSFEIFRNGDFEILDYQIPVTNRRSGMGYVDLVVIDKARRNVFLTEAKPQKGSNNESLLRMISEILTLSNKLCDTRSGFAESLKNDYGLQNVAIHKAILFFTGSPQANEYGILDSRIARLLNNHKISVFEVDIKKLCIKQIRKHK